MPCHPACPGCCPGPSDESQLKTLPLPSAVPNPAAFRTFLRAALPLSCQVFSCLVFHCSTVITLFMYHSKVLQAPQNVLYPLPGTSCWPLDSVLQVLQATGECTRPPEFRIIWLGPTVPLVGLRQVPFPFISCFSPDLSHSINPQDTIACLYEVNRLTSKGIFIVGQRCMDSLDFLFFLLVHGGSQISCHHMWGRMAYNCPLLGCLLFVSKVAYLFTAWQGPPLMSSPLPLVSCLLLTHVALVGSSLCSFFLAI